MSFRRWVIYLSCVFASAFILVHAFIPHIHHDGTVCFILNEESKASECDHHQDSDHQDCNHQDGHHHNHGPLENCKLIDIQIRPEVNEHITPDLSDQFALSYLILFFASESPLFKTDLDLNWQPKPYLNLYNSILAESIHNLRAPPAFVTI